MDVYWESKFVGRLMQQDSGHLVFAYDEDYIANGFSPISMSLPLQLEPFQGKVVGAFFSGILPDESVRYRLSRYLGVSEQNSFAILEAIGGECAGALSFFSKGMKPVALESANIESLNDEQLEDVLELIKTRPLLAGYHDVRLSLAGAQNKIAVRICEEKIALVKDYGPTSHILKPSIEHVHDSVFNEYFCMKLSSMMGIETASVDVGWAGKLPYLLVERYDRRTNKTGQLYRLHQEDFCQATSIPSDLKYEREGGPSIRDCQHLIQKACSRPALEQLEFLKRIIFNYLIGNADAHGKNFSLLYDSPHVRLAPAYDLLCTTVYPELSSKMAMKIGKEYDPDTVFLRHWYKLVPDTALAQRNVRKMLIKMSAECLEKATLLAQSCLKTEYDSEIYKQIIRVITSRAEHVQS